MRSIDMVTEESVSSRRKSDKKKRTTRNHDTILIGIATLWRVSVVSVAVVLTTTDTTNQTSRSMVV